MATKLMDFVLAVVVTVTDCGSYVLVWDSKTRPCRKRKRVLVKKVGDTLNKAGVIVDKALSNLEAMVSQSEHREW